MTFQLEGRAAETYEEVLVPLWFGRWAEALVDLVDLHPSDRVLDVACGTGVTTRLARRMVGHEGRIDGLDINASMLEIARELAEGLDIGWIESDVTEIGLSSLSCDVVMAQHGYHYFPDKPAALAEFRRLLAPRGRLALSVWDGHSPYTEALCNAVEHHISPDVARKQRAQRETPSADELTSQIQAAGFADVSVYRQELLIEVPLMQEFVPLHLSSMPIAGAFLALDQLARQGLIDDVAAALEPYVQEDKVAYPDAVLVAVGIRT